MHAGRRASPPGVSARPSATGMPPGTTTERSAERSRDASCRAATCPTGRGPCAEVGENIGLRDGDFNGIFYAMNATIDRAGRLVVPKTIREAAHLQPGTKVRFRLVEGRVEIEPLPMKVTLERSGSLVVAVPRGDRPVLTTSEVARTIAGIRARTSSPDLPG